MKIKSSSGKPENSINIRGVPSANGQHEFFGVLEKWTLRLLVFPLEFISTTEVNIKWNLFGSIQIFTNNSGKNSFRNTFENFFVIAKNVML